MQKSKKFIIEDKQGNNMYPATFADVVYTEDGGNVAEKLKQIEGATPNAHTHTKSQITDFAHTHTKSEISDFNHTHTKEEITNFPTSLPANGGNADTVGGVNPDEFARKTGVQEGIISGGSKILDTRNDNQPPSWYFSNKESTSIKELKMCNAIQLPSNSGTMCTIETITSYNNETGGKINQIAYLDGKLPMIRFSNGNEAWGEWQPLGGNTGGVIKSIQRGFIVVNPKENEKTVTLSQIDASKSFVVLNGDYVGSSSPSRSPYVKTLNNGSLVISNSYRQVNDSYTNISWQVIEFY